MISMRPRLCRAQAPGHILLFISVGKGSGDPGQPDRALCPATPRLCVVACQTETLTAGCVPPGPGEAGGSGGSQEAQGSCPGAAQ